MPRMTPDEYNQFIQRRQAARSYAFADNPRTIAVVEPTSRDAALGADEAQEGSPARILVRIESIRKRLIDEDNLSCKGVVDALRYASIIPGDEPEKVSIKVTQRKVKSGEEEHTRITITYPR